MNIYSIKNEKLGYFNRPMYCESDPEALVYIQNVLLSDADRALLSLKGDLSLYYLGNIDFTNGKITSAKKPVLITTLEEIFNKIPEDKIPRTEKFIIDKIKEIEKKVGDLSVSNVES